MRPCLIVGALILLALFTSWVGSADDKQEKPTTVPGLELHFARGTRESIDDKAGYCQYSGGKLLQMGKQIGNYATVLRGIRGGTYEQNTAILTITIFFLGKNPPENMTLQGSYHFSSGDGIGSVSAASAQYSAYIGKSFTCKDATELSIK